MIRADKALMKNVVFLIVLVIVGIFIYANKGHAQELRLLEAEELSFSSYKIETYHDPYFVDNYGRQNYGQYDDAGDDKLEEYWSWGVALDAQLTLIQYGHYTLHWENKITGDSTNTQFRQVAWNYNLGFNIYDKIDFYWEHESRHHMESVQDKGYYPLKDKFGIKFIFFKREP